MNDAALTVAQIVAPPRPPQSAQSDSSDDVASGDSDFGTVLQSRVDAQTSTPIKSSSPKSAGPSGATESRNAEPSDDNDTANTTEVSKPVRTSKPVSSAKANAKADNETDDKKSAADSTDANILLALQAQRVNAATPKGCDQVTMQANAPQSNTAPASAIAEGSAAAPQSTAPSPAEIAAALAQGSTNATPLVTSPESAAAAKPTNTQQTSTPASKAPQSATKLGGAQTVAQTQTNPAASLAASVAQETQAQTASPALDEQVVDAASTQGTTPKKGNASKDESASTNTNTLLGVLAATGSSDAKVATNADANAASGASDGKVATGIIGAGSSAVTQDAPADKPQPAVPGGITAKANVAQDPFDPKTKNLATTQQQANVAQATRSADPIAALTPKDQSAATTANTQQTPAQPAVPAGQGLTQNQAFITANIVQTTAAPANPTPTLHAQMDGPRLTLPTDQIALEIRRHQFAGSDHFNIKIDPPELGRIDVKIEMTSDGQTKAHLTADRQDTLDLLQRDSGHLERALNSNGLRTDKDSLNFSLRQDNQPGRGGNGTGDGGSQGRGSAANTYYGSDEELIDVAPVYARIADPTRVDILI